MSSRAIETLIDRDEADPDPASTVPMPAATAAAERSLAHTLPRAQGSTTIPVIAGPVTRTFAPDLAMLLEMGPSPTPRGSVPPAPVLAAPTEPVNPMSLTAAEVLARNAQVTANMAALPRPAPKPVVVPVVVRPVEVAEFETAAPPAVIEVVAPPEPRTSDLKPEARSLKPSHASRAGHASHARLYVWVAVGSIVATVGLLLALIR